MFTKKGMLSPTAVALFCLFCFCAATVKNVGAVDTSNDLETRAAAADDWGHAVHYMPSEVVRPTSDAEVREVILSAKRRHQQVTVRGFGHSAAGQAQCCGCIVMDMSAMSAVRNIDADTIEVEAGAQWRVALDALDALGRTTVTQTDWPGLSVGGVLSGGGGMGPGLFRNGFIAESIVSLTVVTGRGQIEQVSPTQNADLFDAVVGGMGQFGVVTAVRLRTVPIPGSMVRVYHVYQTVDSVWADYTKVLDDEAGSGAPFDQLQSFPTLNFPGTGAASGYAPDYFVPQAAAVGAWVLIQEYAVFYEPGQEPDDAVLFGYFDHVAGSELAADMPYAQWIRRLDFVFGVLLPSGDFNYAWKNPHPWYEVLLPFEEAEDFVKDMLAGTPPSDTPIFSVQAMYPFKESTSRRLLQPLPDSQSNRLVYFGFLRQVDIASAPNVFAENARLTAINSDLRASAEEVGGTPVLTSTLPASRQEWDDLIEIGAYTQAKWLYDPARVLGPGIGSTIERRLDPCVRNGRDSTFSGTE